MIEVCSEPGCMNAVIPTKKFCLGHSITAHIDPRLFGEKDKADKDKLEFSGSDVNYYLLEITDPKRLKPCTVECEDIIEALGMTFAEGNVLKSLWRSCNMRVHGHGKRGQDDAGTYDGDKIAYYGARVKVQRHRIKKA